MMDWVTAWVAAGGYPAVFALMFLDNLFLNLGRSYRLPNLRTERLEAGDGSIE